MERSIGIAASPQGDAIGKRWLPNGESVAELNIFRLLLSLKIYKQ